MSENVPNDTGGGNPPPGDPGLGIGAPTPEPGSGLGGPPATPPVAPSPAPKPPEPPATPPSPAPRAPAPKAPTVGDGAPPKGQEPTPPAPATWPENWREQMAGDNKKAQERAKRFNSPNDILNSYLALEGKLSGGEFTKKLPSHPTEAELAEYRKANGIPDKPEGYDTSLGNGIVWGEADKPLLESWTKHAHDNNFSADVVKKGLEWYAREQEAIVERLVETDMANYQAGTAALQAEWGPQFKSNLNSAKAMLDAYPGVWDSIMGSRDGAGMRNGDNPAVLKALAAIAKELNPFAAVAPTTPGQTPEQSIAGRLKELNGMMGDRSSAYWRGAQSNALQAEYRELIDQQTKLAARNAGRA
ncbi:MAG: hypothetical protein JO107_14180 [Hyphomicrobiales bacterium]|nr:hypothetical protein [Hyphomicrobiales bacterium]MBV8664237.1 hypothetical protein [Hyphomicrobiales bacterium]